MLKGWTEHTNEEYKSRWYTYYITDHHYISLDVCNPTIQPDKNHAYVIRYYHNDTIPQFKQYTGSMPFEEAKTLALSLTKTFFQQQSTLHRNIAKCYDKLQQELNNIAT